MQDRWVSVSEFQSPALDIGKNTCFGNEWQWFYIKLMYTGQVIDNQRFGKVMKKATHYPQIWHVNLETLSFFCKKTESTQNQNKKIVIFFHTKKDLNWMNFPLMWHFLEINCMRENKQFKNHVSKVFSFCMCVSKSLNYMYRNIFFLSVNVERPTVGRALTVICSSHSAPPPPDLPYRP